MKVTVVYPGSMTFLVPVVNQDSDELAIAAYVYRQTNHVDGTEFVAKMNVRSSIVGDVFIIKDKYFLIEPTGFKELSEDVFLKWQVVPVRDRIMGYAWCAANELI